jgi:geranylgeranyl pyrophosphate synthase
MSDTFCDYLALCKQRCEQALLDVSQLPTPECQDPTSADLTSELHSALDYSLLNGGKRIRPALVYASAAAIDPNCSSSSLDRIAASIESLHCYSLVHDDLPAMDDDELRRGRPTCHKAYDEATAILAGDALQSLAFELIADCTGLSCEQRIELVKVLASAAGSRGMVGGQFIDLSLEQHTPALKLLETMHALKTGALIRAAVAMGAIAAGASKDQRAALDSYGRTIGLAFQVKDDLLDIECSTEVLGKQQGSDLVNHKMTYPALLGVQGSRDKLAQLLEKSQQALKPLGADARRLLQLADYIVNRDY